MQSPGMALPVRGNQSLSFDAQPNVGGLGILQNQPYYQQGGPGMYAQTGFQ